MQSYKSMLTSGEHGTQAPAEPPLHREWTSPKHWQSQWHPQVSDLKPDTSLTKLSKNGVIVAEHSAFSLS